MYVPEGSTLATGGQSDREATPTPLPRLAGKRHLLGVVGLALVVRVAYWVVVARDYAPASDASQYDELARNLASGRGFSLVFPQLALHPTAWRPPAYPALLGFVYWVFGPSVGAGMVLNLLIGLGVVALTYQLAMRLGGPLAAIVAAGLVAAYPPLVVNDLCLLTEPLSLLLLLGMSLCLIERRPLLAGLFTGLLVLARPSAQGLVLIVGIWCLSQMGWRRTLQISAVAAIVVVPWIVRNWVELGSPVLVTSNGFNLAAMHSTEAEESHHFVNPVLDRRFADTRFAQFDEVGWDRLLRNRTLKDMRRHPGHVARVITRNVASYFEFRPADNSVPERLDGRNPTFRAIGLPFFYVVTVSGLAGFWLNRRDPRALLVAILATYFALTSLVFVAPPRLRAPFDLICCIGVGLFAAWLAPRRRAPVAPAATSA